MSTANFVKPKRVPWTRDALGVMHELNDPIEFNIKSIRNICPNNKINIINNNNNKFYWFPSSEFEISVLSDYNLIA
jgi:hypothetical protein